MMIQAHTTRQEGMAIIAALVVVAAAAVVTAAIMERHALLADTLAGERDRSQARWLLRGGLDWARVILSNDARRNAITVKDAIWGRPIVDLEISPPGDARKAYFSGQIIDEQSKYNIWGLAANGVVLPQEVAVLQRLFEQLNLPASLATDISLRVAAGQPSPATGAVAPGLRTLNGLLALSDMSPDILTTLSAYLTIIPQKTAINVNTASAEVLSASVPGLDLAQARAMTEQRDRGQWFNSSADFFNRLGGRRNLSGDRISVDSEWFKVTGEVTLGRVASRMQALLQRRGDEPPFIRWIED